MPTPALDAAAYVEIARTIASHNGNVREAAKAQSELAIGTFETRAKKARDMGLWGRDGQGGIWTKIDSAPVPRADPLPDDDEPVDQLIKLAAKRFERRLANHKARQWREFRVPIAGPYALMFFGDPHLDDDGCNWKLLLDHAELSRRTEGLFAVSIGDVTNNWVGRLMALYAKQDASESTARKYVKWFLTESGIPWWLWIHGNHDAWNSGITTIEGMNAHQIAMEDWQAKVTLASPKGRDLRLWAAHNFPGHSQWNKLHGAQKAATMKAEAHIYVAGHHHNWALHQEEEAERGFTYWLARCRGYKFLDDYAFKLGFGEQQQGSSIVAVVDPEAMADCNHVQMFADPHEATEYLAFKRRKI